MLCAMRTLTLSATLATFLVVSAAWALQHPGEAARLGPSRVSAGDQEPVKLTVVVGCEACEADVAPTVSLLWLRAGADGRDLVRAIQPMEWGTGAFEMRGADLADGLALNATDSPEGWVVEVPLLGRPLPFRATVSLRGFVADQAAFWPDRDRSGEARFTLRTTREILEAHPSWDPERADECDALVPKDGEAVRTFRVDGQPAAWLFPTHGADDGSWTFQFVKPGGNLLSRMEVTVHPSDEGDSWGFRLPLSGVLPTVQAGKASLSVALTAGELSLGGFTLGDCPRAPR